MGQPNDVYNRAADFPNHRDILCTFEFRLFYDFLAERNSHQLCILEQRLANGNADNGNTQKHTQQ